ncbi:hypothetical protein DY000_02049974 [Brassica cretica]|uniref:AP2/ERF domain-containing protein n=1 Tax=Brassica cretica TaxID=69181 RepID=A0ABQ7EXJ7_BRACR|nr:hypothetical protein DY000_02049974 [Brassica cretica]
METEHVENNAFEFLSAESSESPKSLRSEWKQAKKSPTCFRRKISTETPIETKRKAFRSGFKREHKGGAFLGLTGRYVASWRPDRSLRSEWKQAKKSPTCFRRKISTETPIETKQKVLR